MSLRCPVGPEANLLEVTPDHCARMVVEHPILSLEEMQALKVRLRAHVGAYRQNVSSIHLTPSPFLFLLPHIVAGHVVPGLAQRGDRLHDAHRRRPARAGGGLVPNLRGGCRGGARQVRREGRADRHPQRQDGRGGPRADPFVARGGGRPPAPAQDQATSARGALRRLRRRARGARLQHAPGLRRGRRVPVPGVRDAGPHERRGRDLGAQRYHVHRRGALLLVPQGGRQGHPEGGCAFTTARKES